VDPTKFPGYKPTSGENPFSDLEDAPPAAASTPPPIGKPSTPPEKPTTPEPSPSPKPSDKSKSEPTGETKADHPIDPKPGGEQFRTSKELREAYASAKADATAKTARLTELESKLAKLEASPGNTDRLEAHVSGQIETLKKQLAEKDDRLAELGYEYTEDFKTKFENRYNSKEKAAIDYVTQLAVTLEDGSTRPGTANDYALLMRLPLAQADAKAEEMFGRGGARIMARVEELKEIARESREAVAQHKETWKVKAQEEAVRKAQEKEAHGAMWTRLNKDISEKVREFRPTTESDPDHDPEYNALLKKGFEESDTFFHNRADMTAQERVLLDTRIRNQSAAFRPMRHKVKAQAARIAELESKLAEFVKSEPGDVRREAGGEGKPASTKGETWEQRLDRMPG